MDVVTRHAQRIRSRQSREQLQRVMKPFIKYPPRKLQRRLRRPIQESLLDLCASRDSQIAGINLDEGRRDTGCGHNRQRISRNASAAGRPGILSTAHALKNPRFMRVEWSPRIFPDAVGQPKWWPGGIEYAAQPIEIKTPSE